MSASAMTYALILIVGSSGQYSSYGAIRESEKKDQSESFQRLWDDQMVWTFDDLPAEGGVPEYRIPYSGYIYLDRAGGTASALAKYDRAFYGGRSVTVSFERNLIYRQQDRIESPRRGLFGRMLGRTTIGTPHWYGHCNGWTAASIRHAEPEHSVTRNGVTFSPADIKGLLAELYMYCDTEFLGGVDTVINPATFHAVVTNWIGRKQNPIGMEADPGEEVWNYPLYAYAYSSAKRSNGRQVEVKMNTKYANSINHESNTPVRQYKTKYFHYTLDLNEAGEITGGRYFGDSARLDMLWGPLKPYQGGTEHNKRGNPHLDVNEVIALWKASVSDEIRNKWVNVDPIEPRTEAQPDSDVLVSAEDAEPAAEDDAEDAGAEAEAAEADAQPETAETASTAEAQPVLAVAGE